MSPGAPEVNLRRLSPEQLALSKSGKFAAVAMDLRGRPDHFKANFNAIIVDGPIPLNREIASQVAEKFRQGVAGALRSSEVVTSPGLPRLRTEVQYIADGQELVVVHVAIPSETKTAVVTYTIPRSRYAQYKSIIDHHASQIAVAAGLQGADGVEQPRALLAHGAQVGDVHLMRRALAAGADVNAEFGVNTPLGVAARAGQVGAAAFLLKHGANVNQRYGLPMRSALHDAALAGQLEMVRFLVESGATVNLRNKFGRTPLTYASKPTPPLQSPPNSEEIVRYLRSVGATE